MKFSLKLKELREERGFTQRDLANALNLSKGCIGMWESTDRIPNAKQLVQIAKYFGISVDSLLEVDEITPEEKKAGASGTKKMSITPIEDEMLYLFREVGKRHGEKGQRAMLDLAENLLKM